VLRSEHVVMIVSEMSITSEGQKSWGVSLGLMHKCWRYDGLDMEQDNKNDKSVSLRYLTR
jgi:hypothetical protein